MPELSIIGDDLGTGQFIFRNVGDIAFDAQKPLRLCLKGRVEDEGLVCFFGLLDELGPPAGFIAFKQSKGSVNLLVKPSSVLFVACFRELANQGWILDNARIAEAS